MQSARLAAVAALGTIRALGALGALGALALGPAALGACYRDRAPAGPVANVEPSGDDARASASDPLAFLPIDSDLVIGIDARQIVRSALWKYLEPQLMQRLGGGLAELRQACGFDLLAALRGVAMGVRQGPPADGVIVLRGLPRDQTMACLARGVAGRGPARLEGNVAIVPGADPGDPPVVVAFAGATTAVIAGSRERLHAALAAGAPLRRSRAFSELWSLVDTRRAAWFVGNGSMRSLDRMSALGVRPRAVFGSMSLASGLSLISQLRVGSPDEAAQLAAVAQAQSGALQGMADKLEISAEGPDVTLRLEMTEAQLESLAGLALGVWASRTGP
jgi:hypothetical protein